jgi:hypothetical protein
MSELVPRAPENGIRVDLSFRADWSEVRNWHPRQIDAFLHGIAQVAQEIRRIQRANAEESQPANESREEP